MTSTKLRRQGWRRTARGGGPNTGAGLLVGCAVFAVCFLVCPQTLLGQESDGLVARQSEHHYRLGLRHVQSGDFQSAEREYRKAIAMDSTDVRPRDGLGFVYALQKKFREAEVEFERVLEINPDYAPSLYKLGKIFLIRREREKAKDAYERAIASEPTYFLAHHGLGMIYSQEGKPTEAAEHFKTVLRLKSDYGPSRYRLGAIYLREQEYAKAIAELQQAAKTDENEPAIHYILGNAYMAIGRAERSGGRICRNPAARPRSCRCTRQAGAGLYRTGTCALGGGHGRSGQTRGRRAGTPQGG